MATPRRDRSARIVDTALGIVTERGWSAVSLDSVAEKLGLDRAEIYRLAPTRSSILGLFARRIDIDVAESADAAPPDEAADEAPRDRLFDILMRRFDVLEQYREAVRALARDLPRDPMTAAALLPQVRRSFAMMLREAGIADNGLQGHLRVSALAGVWAATLPVWLRDETDDRAPTMAALDRCLDRLFGWSPLFREANPPPRQKNCAPHKK